MSNARWGLNTPRSGEPAGRGGGGRPSRPRQQQSSGAGRCESSKPSCSQVYGDGTDTLISACCRVWCSGKRHWDLWPRIRVRGMLHVAEPDMSTQAAFCCCSLRSLPFHDLGRDRAALARQVWHLPAGLLGVCRWLPAQMCNSLHQQQAHCRLCLGLQPGCTADEVAKGEH